MTTTSQFDAPKKRAAPVERLTNLDLTGISPTFDDFVAHFGHDNAIAMVKCGLHRVERPEKHDPFLDCVNVAISYQCLTVYYGHDGFTADKDLVQDWVRKNFPFETYDADDDSMSKNFKKTFQDYLGL